MKTEQRDNKTSVRLDAMTRQHRRAIEAECARLSVAMVNAVDARDYPRAVEVFTADGKLIAPHATVSGHAGILDFLHTRPLGVVTRHICSNFEVQPNWDGTASGLCYVVCFKAPGPDDTRAPLPTPAPIVGEYHDRYLHTASGWKIHERSMRLLFAPTHPPEGQQ